MNDERQAGSALAPARENSDVNPLRATSRLTLVNVRPAAAFLDNDVCVAAVETARSLLRNMSEH
jgi:hypothetical protein